MPDPRLKTYAPQAVRHLAAAGGVLAARQEQRGAARGNVPPWPGSDDPDFHGTLAAIWIWARLHRLEGGDRFGAARAAAWAFVDSAAKTFVPDAIDSAAGDEAAYDCALVLVAAGAERAIGALDARRQALVERAARVLANHLDGLEDLSGRAFADPGYLAVALLEHARAVEDRGLLASGRKFVERAFGMKPPPAFAREPAAPGGLFDFSCTTGTRVLAVMAAEGATPFVGAWLRERVAASAPGGWVSRALDENTWNACAAWVLGRAYVVSTDPVFLESYSAIVDQLDQRDTDRDGALGRDKTVRAPETSATFYYALAVDALVTPESLAALHTPTPTPTPPPPPPPAGGAPRTPGGGAGGGGKGAPPRGGPPRGAPNKGNKGTMTNGA
jgi:hypothetical protein